MLFGFPEATWSAPYFPKVSECFAKLGIEYYNIEEHENIGDTSPMIYVRCGRDIDLATRVSRAVLLDVFGLSETDSYDIIYGTTLVDLQTACADISYNDLVRGRGYSGIPISTSTVGRVCVAFGFMLSRVTQYFKCLLGINS